MPITITGPDWPTTHALRAALATVPEIGATIHWGAGAGVDKFAAFAKLRAGGCYTPLATRARDEALDWVRYGLEVWGRRLRHTQGRDIARFNHAARRTAGGLRWSGRDFWVQVLPSVREWRCHVWQGRAFRTGVKQRVALDGLVVDPFNTAGAPVRSDRLGWSLRYSDAALAAAMPDRSPLLTLAKAACTALSIAGGAVDILESPTKELYVLEVNTAPALGERTLDAYVSAIRRAAQEIEPRA